MIDRVALLSDLQPVLKRLEDDLRVRAEEDRAADARFREEYARARAAKRTAQAFEVWRDDQITQIAVAWVLSAVFVRFLEDNGLVDAPLLSGPGERLRLARDRHTLYFRKEPRHSDVHYLRAVFEEVGALSGLHALFDKRNNALWQLDPSADGATDLLGFFQKLDPSTGNLVHDFTDGKRSTRFLGDLYQDLSERARKHFALLQTPEFVEEFILDRTLEPAIAEFGFDKVRLIDPACGSGHFLLGAFGRLFRRWMTAEPATSVEVLAQRALDAVAGVDLNPFAVAIARFRLLLAALDACELLRLKDARDFQIHLAAGDSLLHGPRPGTQGMRQENLLGDDPLRHVYDTEDAPELRRLLGRTYSVVVGNPPYITPKDPALNGAYRERFSSCHRRYSLVVPFIERFTDLSEAEKADKERAGFIGLIISNSFMKREFGRKLIEKYLPQIDLTHIIDTSGAYIPNHGDSPTAILFARNRQPVSPQVRVLMGIRGDSAIPDDPARGAVWTAIQKQIDGRSESEFLSAADVLRERLASFPWSIGGGGAAELKEHLDDSEHFLSAIIADTGRTTHTGEDDAFYVDPDTAVRRGFDSAVVPVVFGEEIRDYILTPTSVTIFPYDKTTASPLAAMPDSLARHFWPIRTSLRARRDFGQTPEERGLHWSEHSMFFPGRYTAKRSIAFAFVATHNQFALNRGSKVFNRTAPAIILSDNLEEDVYLGVLGLLASSVACFWMKQVFYPKATPSGDVSIEKGKPEANRFEFSGSGLKDFPLPWAGELIGRGSLARIAREIHELATQLKSEQPAAIVDRWHARTGDGQLAAHFLQGEARSLHIRRRMIALQEELDWECYRAFSLSDKGSDTAIVQDETLGIDPDDRPFRWPNDAAPPSLPAAVASTYSRRRKLLSDHANLKLIETPVYKRPWLGQQGVFGHSTATYADKVSEALRDWLLRRLEDARYWPRPTLTSAARLADRLRDDPDFLQVATLYRGRADFDLTNLVTEFVLDEGVPFVAAMRYAPTGLRKRAVWEHVWDLQRREDAKEPEIGDIPVPPKYASADFQKQSYWRLRGKLDVPKERFILYPGAEREGDASPVIGWAGWDHQQQAEALVLYYQDMQEKEGWSKERLVPLLVGLLELVPWLKQWHNAPGPTGRGVGDDYEQFLRDEATGLGVSLDDLKSWQPAKATRGRARRS